MEMNILLELLEKRGIQAVEASGALAPAQNAFCAKICSKIIMSQFCIILLNNESKNGQEVPNANVNMEYGLMLGFNKYIIPFQRESQELPFNVAGLDTIKYTNSNFKTLAIPAIEQAIRETQQDRHSPLEPDQLLGAFLLTQKALISPLESDGEKNFFNLGVPLGFNLLNDFSAMQYMFLGNFAAFRPEIILWRLETLRDIIDGRRKSIKARVNAGFGTAKQAKMADKLVSKVEFWVIVTSEGDKKALGEGLKNSTIKYPVRVFSMEDIQIELEKLGKQVG